MRHLLWLFMLPLAAQTNFSNGDFNRADKFLGSQWCFSYSWSTSSPTVQGSDDMYNQNYVSVSVQKEDFDGSCYAMASHAQVLMSFDTSAIGSGATVTAATLYFFVDGRTSSSAQSHTIEQSRIDCWAELEPRFLATWQRRRRDLADQSQSGYDMALADFGGDAGLSDQEIADLICYHRRLHGQKPRKVADYYERTIAKARGERMAGSGQPVLPGTPPAPHVAPVRPESGSLTANPSQSHDPSAKAFEQLSNYAGVRVLRVVKLTGEEPSYRLHLEGGLTLHFADVGRLINQTTVRNALVGATNRLVSKIRTKQWELVVAAMLSVLEEEDGGPECDRGGMIRLYLDSYLRDVQFIPAIEGQPSHVARRPLVLRDTVERDGAICTTDVIAVSAVDLQQHVSRTFGAPYSVKALASMLAAIGAKSRPVLHHGSRIQGRWLLPLEEFNPEDYAARAEAEEGVQE